MIIYFFPSIFFSSKMFAFFILMFQHTLHTQKLNVEEMVRIRIATWYEYGWIGDGIR